MTSVDMMIAAPMLWKVLIFILLCLVRGYPPFQAWHPQ